MAALVPKAAAQDPAFTTIQPPDGDGTITFVFDINNRGDMVGAYNAAPDGHRYGFLRNKDGEFTRIDFPGSFRTHADGINSMGDIVGWYARVPGEIYGYLRTKDGEFTQIRFPGATDTRAVGINSRGDIVGFYCVVTAAAQCGLVVNNRTHGFLLREGNFTTIDLPDAFGTQAYKINSHGQILGRYRDAGPERRSHLFLLSKGEFTTIDFPDAVETGVGGTNAGLNSRGDIVGDYCEIDTPPCRTYPLNGTVHGFLLRGGEFTTIDVPGAIATSALGINGRGDIVGVFSLDASHTVGFLRTSGERNEHENRDE
jgi:uncharacterized membrane protein